jgi:glycosyltransferase involved in cell wall biosynthesis
VHGLAAERLRVVPAGVNERIFKPKQIAHEGFVFLSVGKYEKRKSIDEVVEAYRGEFPADQYPHVQLWLKADFPLFPERVQQLEARLADDRRIRVVSGVISDFDLAALYNQADAFVFPSKAEGFGLPCIEAIACGVPVLATRYSGQTVFLDRIEGCFIPIDFTIGPIDDADYRYFYGSQYGAEPFGSWAVPSMGSIRRSMRTVFEDHDGWRERALRASTIVRESFAWDSIARHAIGQLNGCRQEVETLTDDT